ncbi:MAG: hypothetical protein WEB30_10935 [Cyclobacteriaceae bacterium]
MNTTTRTMGAICIFSIAMAALESAVVVYLRALYYPDGFSVAFKLIDEKILGVEIMREAATLTMLLSVGYLAGKNLRARIAYFLLTFGVWDIFYYAWLKVFIDWPASIFDWDILFLIPIAWLGPVLAPIICSLTMILLAMVLILNSRRVTPALWILLLTGSAFILYTFMEDYGGLLIRNGLLSGYASILRNEDFIRVASEYMPTSFSWGIFSLGEAFLLGGIFFQYQGWKGFRKPADYPRAQGSL